jgi:transcriptional regulator with XRE-family HTH domain
MIIIYDLKKYIEDNGLKQSYLAKEIGISKQLFRYHLNKGDVPVSMLSIIAESTNKSVDKLIKELNKEYIKRKI